VKYYDQLRSELAVEFLGKRVNMDDIGMMLFFSQLVSFTLIYSFSTVDIVLLIVWAGFFANCSLNFRHIASLMAQKFSVVWDSLTAALALICFVQFVFMHPFLMAALVVIAWLTTTCLIVHQGRVLPQFDLDDDENRKLVYWCAAISFCSQMYFYSTSGGLLRILCITVLQAVFFPLNVIYTRIPNTIVMDHIYGPLIDGICNRLIMEIDYKYWKNLFFEVLPKLEVRFFQFFFVYYFCRFVLALLLL
jgi:hypothetical protein